MKVKFVAIVFLFFTLVGESLLAQDQSRQSVEKNGMTLAWQIEDNQLQVTMRAPTTGWVAIGINPKNQLAGSSFLMGRVQQGIAEVVDYYTIQPGDVHPVVILGGKSAVDAVSGFEEDNTTTITFELQCFPSGNFHHQLEVGAEYYIHLAYSQDDDFAHHSRMRTVVKIRI